MVTWTGGAASGPAAGAVPAAATGSLTGAATGSLTGAATGSLTGAATGSLTGAASTGAASLTGSLGSAASGAGRGAGSAGWVLTHRENTRNRAPRPTHRRTRRVNTSCERPVRGASGGRRLGDPHVDGEDRPRCPRAPGSASPA